MGPELNLLEIAGRQIPQAFQTLLSEKHLYQSVTVNLTDFPSAAASAIPAPPPRPPTSFNNVSRPTLQAVQETPAGLMQRAKRFIDLPWAFSSGNQWPFIDALKSAEVSAMTTKTAIASLPPIALPTIKVPCDICDSVLPPHHFQGNSWGSGPYPTCFSISTKEGAVPGQDFCLTFRCQSCTPEQSQPVTFLVHREGLKLRLVGRSRLERIEVPRFIPKEEADFFREVEIAQKAGKGLAAIFYLRVFIEQHMRRVAGTKGQATGDELAREYVKYLPEDYPKKYPSFRVHYENLSIAIHSAMETPELLESVMAALIDHFKYLDLFPLKASVPVDAP